MIRKVLRQLRDQGKIAAIGKGRNAKWKSLSKQQHSYRYFIRSADWLSTISKMAVLVLMGFAYSRSLNDEDLMITANTSSSQ